MIRLFLVLVVAGVLPRAEAGKLKEFAKAGLAAGIILTASVQPAVAQDVWKRVKKLSPAHQKSVMYLVLDGQDDAWRVMHAEYLGGNLFLASRLYIVDDHDASELIFDNVETSIVNYDGLMEQGIEVTEVASYRHPHRTNYDLTVLEVKGVDFSELEPITVVPFPDEEGTELEMVSYRVDKVNPLAFFDYPAMSRECASVSNLHDDLMGLHTCGIPFTPAVFGSPIFLKETGELVSLYFGETNQGFNYGVTLPAAPIDDLLTFLLDLEVSEKGKMATTWGSLKRRE